MNRYYDTRTTDHGGEPYVTNVERNTIQNTNFRTAIWTGKHVQMTLMCIPPCGEIGLEIHPQTDQLIRIEQGRAVVQMGEHKGDKDFVQSMYKGDVTFIPAGIWHNLINIGNIPLKVSVTYAPPNHPKYTTHRTKEEADREED